MVIRFLAFFLLSIQIGLACDMETPGPLSLYTSLESNESYFYKNDSILESTPTFQAHNCIETARSRKYLMIALGVEFLGLENIKKSLSFTGQFQDDQCRITNSPFEITPDFKERYYTFKKQNDYAKKCLETVVYHQSRRPLQYPENQYGCIIRKEGNHYVMQGGFCYLRPNADSTFTFKLRVKDICLDQEGMNRLRLKPMELNAAMNFYVAGDASGNSIDLKALESTPIRISVDPDKTRIQTSRTFGAKAPRWPSQYLVPETHIGSLSLKRSYGNFYRFKADLLVDNKCNKESSLIMDHDVCNYSTPVTGKYTLYRIEEGRRVYIADWYDGGVAPARWQGFLRTSGENLDHSALKPNTRYELKISFNHPRFDYDALKGRMKTLQTKIGTINRLPLGGQIPKIPRVPTLGRTPTLPEVPGVGLNVGGQITGIDEILAYLGSYLDNSLWPPYYGEICNSDQSHCSNNPEFMAKFIVNFDLGEFSNRARSIPLNNVRISRESRFLSPYRNQEFSNHSIECGSF